MGFALSDIQLTSTAFENNGAIQPQHTGEGSDISPSLAWKNPPEGTQAFAVICHDPDAPLISNRGTYGFVHWAYYNIPGSVYTLDEGCNLYTKGANDFGKEGYNGPMPPNGHGRHRYYYWILALDSQLDLPAGLTMWELLEQAEPHVIGMNRLVGSYIRT